MKKRENKERLQMARDIETTMSLFANQNALRLESRQFAIKAGKQQSSKQNRVGRGSINIK